MYPQTENIGLNGRSTHSKKKIERNWDDFWKKPVFWGAKGLDPEQTKDLETRIEIPRGTPKIPCSAKILRREFWTSGGAQQLQG